MRRLLDRPDLRHLIPTGPMPIGPSVEEWARLSPAEKERRLAEINAALPLSEVMSESTVHSRAKRQTAETLESYFARIRRGVFIAEELTVVYPDEPVFVPDVLAVLDVPLHDRQAWTVAEEGKGPDFVLEIHTDPDALKDTVKNVERYARLGIPEYFVYDCRRFILRAYRLPEVGARRYVSVLPHAGRFASLVLELELAVVDGRLRFFKDAAEVPAPSDLVNLLTRMVDEREARVAEAEAREREQDRRFRDAILAILAARGLTPSPEDRQRVETCADPALLSRWITRAATAATMDEVFTDPKAG